MLRWSCTAHIAVWPAVPDGKGALAAEAGL